MKKLLVAVCFLLPLLTCADGLPTGPYIYVVGHGEASAPADIARFSFQLSADNTDQDNAKAAVTAQSADVLKFLAGLGVADSDIEAYAITSAPRYDYSSLERRQEFIGYHVERSFSVTLRDLAHYRDLVDGLFTLKVGNLGSARLDSTKAGELDAEASARALADAHAQADLAANRSGMSVASLFALSPVSFPNIKTDFFQSGGGIGPRGFMAAAEKSSPALYIFPPVQVSRTIHVIYLLAPAPAGGKK